MKQTKRRMSIRAVALAYGIPARTVVRAVEVGELPALKTVTETGRERVYIQEVDVDLWISAMLVGTASSMNAQVQ